MERGGMLRTAGGELRVFIVVVRFSDDYVNTPNWPIG